MNVLIGFASKTGTTEKAARMLYQQLTDIGWQTTVADLSKENPSPACYDLVITGSPVRCGMIHKAIKGWLSANESELLTKPFALFLCRCMQNDPVNALAAQVSEKLLNHASKIDDMGGEMDLAKQKGFDRFMVKMISKMPQAAQMHISGVEPERVAAFAQALKETVQA